MVDIPVPQRVTPPVVRELEVPRAIRAPPSGHRTGAGEVVRRVARQHAGEASAEWPGGTPVRARVAAVPEWDHAVRRAGRGQPTAGGGRPAGPDHRALAAGPGFAGVPGVRVGKAIRFESEALDEAAARSEIEDMCAALPHQPGDRGQQGLPHRLRMTAVVGVVVPRVELRAGRRRGRHRSRRPRRGAVARRGHGRRRRRHRGPRRLRPRRLPASGRHRPLLARDVGIAAFARDGGPVVGICNGFQVLTEAGLLPGALRKNEGLPSCAPPSRSRSPRADRP